MDADTNVLRPRVLVLPSDAASDLSHAEVGTLVMSGAKMYVATTVGTFQLVTSA